jgi:CTP:molybdopterin cytidylyltransferase MocA
LFINHDRISENEQAFMGGAMQAVILAAGMGNRLGKYTKDNTKLALYIARIVTDTTIPSQKHTAGVLAKTSCGVLKILAPGGQHNYVYP